MGEERSRKETAQVQKTLHALMSTLGTSGEPIRETIDSSEYFRIKPMREQSSSDATLIAEAAYAYSFAEGVLGSSPPPRASTPPHFRSTDCPKASPVPLADPPPAEGCSPRCDVTVAASRGPAVDPPHQVIRPRTARSLDDRSVTSSTKRAEVSSRQVCRPSSAKAVGGFKPRVDPISDIDGHHSLTRLEKQMQKCVLITGDAAPKRQRPASAGPARGTGNGLALAEAIASAATSVAVQGQKHRWIGVQPHVDTSAPQSKGPLPAEPAGTPKAVERRDSLVSTPRRSSTAGFQDPLSASPSMELIRSRTLSSLKGTTKAALAFMRLRSRSTSRSSSPKGPAQRAKPAERNKSISRTWRRLDQNRDHFVESPSTARVALMSLASPAVATGPGHELLAAAERAPQVLSMTDQEELGYLQPNMEAQGSPTQLQQ